MARHVFPTAQAAAVPREPRRLCARIVTHATFGARWYAARGQDAQAPHAHDEAYVVVSGHGHVTRNGTRAPVGRGDMVRTPAGAEHRFEGCSDGLAVWAMFCGPEGGEA